MTWLGKHVRPPADLPNDLPVWEKELDMLTMPRGPHTHPDRYEALIKQEPGLTMVWMLAPDAVPGLADYTQVMADAAARHDWPPQDILQLCVTHHVANRHPIQALGHYQKIVYAAILQVFEGHPVTVG